ncbi:MAG: maleylpyruvate isomerase family mycothiol-dependent enzyme [Nocardioidaceae bacterium]
MDIPDYIEALRREGVLLAEAATRADLDAPVPTCPDWRVRDLVSHVGYVHRWATAYVAEARTEMMGDDERAVLRSGPDDDALIEWYREIHAGLVRALEDAPTDLACWTFFGAPSPLAFWARRQMHEAGIHRVDAERSGGSLTGFPATIAADGIDELLVGFARRSRRLRRDPARSLAVHPEDSDDRWFVRLAPEAVEVSRADAGADCTVRGPASDLYLLLWNRRGPDGLDIDGDETMLSLWPEKMRVRWS